MQRLNFAFKCHRRNKTQIFAVNGLDFHPIFGTFATCGSDGTQPGAVCARVCVHVWFVVLIVHGFACNRNVPLLG